MKNYRTQHIDGTNHPENLIELIEWLNDVLQSIPDECRKTARIDIDSGSEYKAPFYIMYDRLETDQEYELRLNQHLKSKLQNS
jgi:PhoPQ-activated pathogenicity-related protein